MIDCNEASIRGGGVGEITVSHFATKITTKKVYFLQKNLFFSLKTQKMDNTEVKIAQTTPSTAKRKNTA